MIVVFFQDYGNSLDMAKELDCLGHWCLEVRLVSFGHIRQQVLGISKIRGRERDSKFFYWSSTSASSELEGGVDGWRWFEVGNGLKVEPWGTSLGAGSGRVRVSGADFLRGRSLGTESDSGASVHMGVEGALAGPVRAQEDRGVSLIEIDGGNIPIFWFVASWMARSNSLTSSIVMSGSEIFFY